MNVFLGHVEFEISIKGGILGENAVLSQRHE